MEKASDIMHNAVGHIGVDESQKETLAWVCPTCGPVAPYLIKITGRYIQATCPCERKRREEEKARQERRHWIIQNEGYVFGWLGGRWTDTDLRESRFETFDTRRQQTAYDAAHMFLDIMRGTFILYGSYGTGKTHLLAAICNELFNRQVSSRFTTAPKLFAAIQSRIANNSDYTDLLTQAIRTPLLVIDDIDKAKWTEFREEIYFDIIDERVKRRLPIAISTNRLDELDRFVGGACQSRLSIGQTAIEMTGSDYRLEM